MVTKYGLEILAEVKIDIKTLVVLGGLAVTFGGFYFGTEYRLNASESQLSALKKDQDALKKQVQNLQKKINKINRSKSK